MKIAANPASIPQILHFTQIQTTQRKAQLRSTFTVRMLRLPPSGGEHAWVRACDRSREGRMFCGERKVVRRHPRSSTSVIAAAASESPASTTGSERKTQQNKAPEAPALVPRDTRDSPEGSAGNRWVWMRTDNESWETISRK